MIRQPAVAGQFYPGSKQALAEEVERYLKSDKKPVAAIGVVSPHAGYMYSGPTAGKVFAQTIVPETCIVLSPNHTGMGAMAAVMSDGSWELPTGEVPVDKNLAEKLRAACDDLSEDFVAHLQEHSLEVQLPFLLARQPKLSIVPITLQHIRYDACERVGNAIAAVIKDSRQDILIVASSDMNHYEEHELTKKKDQLAIDKVLELDPKGLLTTCASERISMCGVVPTAVMLIAAKQLGGTKAELISHMTSGDTSGDYGSVVGYAGIAVR